MQTISIPVSAALPVALPASAANAYSVKGGPPQTAPGFAGVIHEILQRSQRGNESGHANPVPVKSAKPAKGGTLSVSAAVVATTGAVVPLSATANLAIPEVTPKTMPQAHSSVDAAPAAVAVEPLFMNTRLASASTAQPIPPGAVPQASSVNLPASIPAGSATGEQLLDAAKKVSDKLSTAIASNGSALETAKLASVPTTIASASDAKLASAAFDSAGPTQASMLPETPITQTAQGSGKNISQAAVLPQLSSLPAGNIATASVLSNLAEPHAA